MPPSLEITVFDNDMKACIKELPPGTTVDDVRRVLDRYRIVKGIRWDGIGEAIGRATRENSTLASVVVARIGEAAQTVLFGKTGPQFCNNEIASVYADLKEIGRAIRMDDTSAVLRNGLFVKANEVALTVKFSNKMEDVFGRETTCTENPAPNPSSSSLALKSLPDGYQFIALASGYVVINQSGAFDIGDPFVASADRLTLFCRIVPLVWGREAFIDRVANSTPSASVVASVKQMAGSDNFAVADHLCKIELRQGKSSQPGRPGTLRFIVDIDPSASGQEAGRVDYHDTGRYREVKQGQLLVERVPMRQSLPGMDVFGKVIDVAMVKDTFFSYGAGVVEEATPDLIRYVAALDGIIELMDHYVNVLPELIVHGDVCVTTGNIKYSRAVMIHGNVQAGFTIDCGDLTIQESVEDNVRITCNGNLRVHNGIFGERTRVTVSGNARIGIVQGAYLRIQGHCTIEKYAYQTKIFCGDHLTVSGEGMIGREKGCIIGGEVAAMYKLDLNSVGSGSILTTLSCGFDPEGFLALKEMLKVEKALKDKIVLLQKRINFNPAEKDALLRRLQCATSERKEALKVMLQELRTAIMQVEKISASVALLSRKSVAPDITLAKIIVRHHVIPQVLVNFINLKKKIFRETSCVNIYYKDNDIIIHEGAVLNIPAPEAAPALPSSDTPVPGTLDK